MLVTYPAREDGKSLPLWHRTRLELLWRMRTPFPHTWGKLKRSNFRNRPQTLSNCQKTGGGLAGFPLVPRYARHPQETRAEQYKLLGSGVVPLAVPTMSNGSGGAFDASSTQAGLIVRHPSGAIWRSIKVLAACCTTSDRLLSGVEGWPHL